MKLREELADSLKKLRDDFGVLAIKAEFEAEGSRKDELIMLRDLVESTGLSLIIKIGGCEAVHDIDQCKLLNADGIMAPMIETPFAMKKFRNAVERVYGNTTIVENIINAETKTCLENYDSILDEGEGFLTGVTVGRGDLSASMGVPREQIEEKVVFEATKQLCEKAKSRGLVTNFGGNIGIESIPFIINMYPYIDRYETRKVVMNKSENPEFIKNNILSALEFELNYLYFKSEYYERMAQEDRARIVRLQKQID